ncbi:type IV secretory system conjugative DNA transfer family protein [Acidiphilium iwatense]|uniref:Type IV secretory system conjugative DNA transfer family protein n=1 Tax=Acidiphilium iwatense TaxID=768198 RepID=A0ABS9DZX9_9PROT|nr:type IV secretory system conjugative DNA transfer family protein [Acidiphilium iwatense]MCF3948253.1 type IV secretory system conjugative DNA transfer family protein [Acidiphilium iwatense]
MRGVARARLVVSLILGAVIFTVLASIIFLLGTGLIGHFAHPFWQWWLYLFEASGNPTVRFWLIASGIPAFAVPFLVGIVALVCGRRITGWSLRRDHKPTRPVDAPIRAPTDNHGHARWMTMDEARRRFPGPSTGYGGIVVGEAYDVHLDNVAHMPFHPADRATWGQGGKAPLLIDPCEIGSTHCMMFAGSGGYKTTTAVSTLLTWTGSAVILDPSVELGPMLREAREAMGHKVYELNPRAARDVGFNALDWIDTGSPLAEIDVKAVVEWICGDTKPGDENSAFFKDSGKELVTALLAHMLWDNDLKPEQQTLRLLREAIVTPENDQRKLLAHIHLHSKSQLARDLAGGLKDIVAETFSGIYKNATSDTAWLSTVAYADLVSGSAFRSADLVTGKTTVFINIPLKALDATPAIARVITGALLNAAYEADGAIQGRVLFLLDEAARLGPMKILETARDCARKYKITLFPFYQSSGQLKELFGQEGPAKWFESVSWYGFAGVKTKAVAEELAAAIGEYGVLAWSEGSNTGNQAKGFEAGSRSTGQTKTYHELKRQLIRAEEIMHDMRDDEQIIFPKSGRPLRCGRSIYFRRPEMAARVAENRFAKPARNAAE